MDKKEQTPENEARLAAAKLAKQYDAHKTLVVINNKNSSVEQIILTAANEVGIDKLVEVILKDKPEWANLLERSIPLGKHEELVANQSELSLATDDAAPASTIDASTLKPSNHVEISLKGGYGGAAYCCHYTMFWLDVNGNIQPQTNYPKSNQWLWSPTIQAGTGRTNYVFKISDFAKHNPESPLNPGDPIWLVVNIVAGTQMFKAGVAADGSYLYKYDPNGGYMCQWGTGTTFNPHFKPCP